MTTQKNTNEYTTAYTDSSKIDGKQESVLEIYKHREIIYKQSCSLTVYHTGKLCVYQQL